MKTSYARPCGCRRWWAPDGDCWDEVFCPAHASRPCGRAKCRESVSGRRVYCSNACRTAHHRDVQPALVAKSRQRSYRKAKRIRSEAANN